MPDACLETRGRGAVVRSQGDSTGPAATGPGSLIRALARVLKTVRFRIMLVNSVS
jgi:hypothetical protein